MGEWEEVDGGEQQKNTEYGAECDWTVVLLSVAADPSWCRTVQVWSRWSDLPSPASDWVDVDGTKARRDWVSHAAGRDEGGEQREGEETGGDSKRQKERRRGGD